MPRTTSSANPPQMNYSQLDGKPEIAAQIGILIGCLAVLERQVPELFRHLAGTANNDASTIVGNFIGFSHRVGLIESLLESRNLEDNDQEFEIARLFCVKLREANAVRNKYAHSLYAQHGRKTLMITYGSDAKRKTVKNFVETDDIKTDVARIERLIRYLSGYLQRNEKPPLNFWSAP